MGWYELSENKGVSEMFVGEMIYEMMVFNLTFDVCVLQYILLYSR